MARMSAIFLLVLAGAVHAQDQKIDIGVAYPSTTMLYATADNSRLTAGLELDELLTSLGSEAGLPGLPEFLRERLELKLTPGEVRKLVRGTRRTSFGLLDITVSGPKLQVVIEHDDLSAVSRALKQARAEKRGTVPEVREHYETLVYLISVPQAPDQAPPGMGMRMNPMGDWFRNQEFWVAVHENKRLVVGTALSSVTDALDFLSFPDDTTDTLLSSARYREAVNEYEKPDALFYASIESIINAAERLGGDQGRGMMWWWILGMWLPMDGDDETVSFMVRLLQYEQFKSASAAMWLDDAKGTLRVDMNVAFHHAPGWFEALRIEPAKRPFTEFIPNETTLAITDCIKDPMALYRRFKDFVVTRARNAGQDKLADGWDEWEKRLIDDGSDLEEVLGLLAGEQAFVLVPKADAPTSPWDFQPAAWGALLSVKDHAKAEKFLYERFLPSQLGAFLRPAEGGLTRATIVEGIELHESADGSIAFALAPREDGSGVLLLGDAQAVRRMLAARAGGGSVAGLASWQAAGSQLPATSSLGIYLNAGAVLTAIGRYTRMFSSMWMWEEEGEDSFDRDDTTRDDDSMPYLAGMFEHTVIAGGAISHDSGIRLRMAAAGWPARDAMQAMVSHFRDVRRNRMVRDDLLKVREAAVAHFAIKGKIARETGELLKLGYLRDEEDAIDAFSDGKQTYALAEVPDNLDMRQAVLLAYQRSPGLRGNHLCVLWNQHVVELTPQQLADAMERARKGEAIDDPQYANRLRPLHEDSGRSVRVPDEWPQERIRVVVIDDNGDEVEAEVDRENMRAETERLLDERNAEKK
ncbi:MAG: hypothetical protein KF696_03535 [Planctomycetes bacterium]|nr:hypothetical protein [Planctomycetota bacterium]MCW8134041.1 hypothetical protein [Planctomycetota bacterium]